MLFGGFQVDFESVDVGWVMGWFVWFSEHKPLRRGIGTSAIHTREPLSQKTSEKRKKQKKKKNTTQTTVFVKTQHPAISIGFPVCNNSLHKVSRCKSAACAPRRQRTSEQCKADNLPSFWATDSKAVRAKTAFSVPLVCLVSGRVAIPRRPLNCEGHSPPPPPTRPSPRRPR